MGNVFSHGESMSIEPSTPLKDLGQDYAKARRLFRRLGFELEPECALTVAEACDQAGISPKDFARTMVAMTPGGTRPVDEWAQAPLRELITHIQERHHAYTRQELDRLGNLLEAALASHADRFPELVQIQGHFAHLRNDLLQHLDAEDKTIFPSILEGRGPVFATLDDLHRMALKEHEAAEELFQNIGVLTRHFSLPLGAPPVVRSLYLGLRDLEEDLFMHIYLENHLLFPRSLPTPSEGEPAS